MTATEQHPDTSPVSGEHDDFDDLLKASSLHAPHVIAARESLPADLRARLHARRAALDAQAHTDHRTPQPVDGAHTEKAGIGAAPAAPAVVAPVSGGTHAPWAEPAAPAGTASGGPAPRKKVILLNSTGSGKTQVILDLIAAALKPPRDEEFLLPGVTGWFAEACVPDLLEAAGSPTSRAQQPGTAGGNHWRLLHEVCLSAAPLSVDAPHRRREQHAARQQRFGADPLYDALRTWLDSASRHHWRLSLPSAAPGTWLPLRFGDDTAPERKEPARWRGELRDAAVCRGLAAGDDWFQERAPRCPQADAELAARLFQVMTACAHQRLVRGEFAAACRDQWATQWLARMDRGDDTGRGEPELLWAGSPAQLWTTGPELERERGLGRGLALPTGPQPQSVMVSAAWPLTAPPAGRPVGERRTFDGQALSAEPARCGLPVSVCHQITGHLIDNHGSVSDLPVQLAYQAAEPYAVRVAFHMPRTDTEWTVSRDLLTAALDQQAGDGDVVAWSQGNDTREAKRWTFLLLRPGTSTALVAIPRTKLRGFLQQTQRIVRRGAEHEHFGASWREFEDSVHAATVNDGH